ncbi:MAG TPA: NAD(P)/FAD-dependent oxidoreductase [Tepidisphaeraceae bacterium]|nr:NAD(P)/FAD-dependent oxidoreductase [Tepidisphaeraceae bacterium]
MDASYDAAVIGSGPNGLSAAIVLARAGRKVLVREQAKTVGGSCRSAEITLPGFTHDICSTVQALAQVSPFLRSLPLAEHGLELVSPPAAYAHPLDDGTAAVAYPSLSDTARTLGPDGAAWEKRLGPLVDAWEKLVPDLLAPLGIPKHPLLMAGFGLWGLRSARRLAESWFAGPHARALFAGVSAHSILPLEWSATAAMGLVLAVSAHAVGWPFARGGSQKLSDALASYFRSLGGTIETGAPVENIDELSGAKAILCDLTPRQFIRMAGHRLPAGYRKRLEKFRYGPGVWKVDWALSDPIPWKAAACAQAGTIHLGGTFDEIADAERAPWEGRSAERPYVLLTQPTLFDPSRAPAGKHVAWAYCHVPHGSTFDMTDRIEAQVERFAPGFRDRIIGRNVMSPAALASYNPNLVGGDITGGANLLSQLFTRPVARINPYSTPVTGLYLCSASTPPGGGVHGMCGYWAAQSALRRELR